MYDYFLEEKGWTPSEVDDLEIHAYLQTRERADERAKEQKIQEQKEGAEALANMFG